MPDQEHLQTRVGGRTYEAFDAYADDGDYSEYVATGELVRRGLEAEGYLDGSANVSKLQRLAGECVRFSAYAAASLIGVMLTTPLPLSAPTVSLLVTALVFTGLWHAEPRVSESISALQDRRGGAEPMTDGGDTDGE